MVPVQTSDGTKVGLYKVRAVQTSDWYKRWTVQRSDCTKVGLTKSEWDKRRTRTNVRLVQMSNQYKRRTSVDFEQKKYGYKKYIKTPFLMIKINNN